MKLSICFYDNVVCDQNPAEEIFPLVRNLLDWVDAHDAFLVIKTKTTEYTPKYLLSLIFKDVAYPPRSKFFHIRRLVACLRGRLPKSKGLICDSYAEDIRAKIKDMEERKRLVIKTKTGDISWGLRERSNNVANRTISETKDYNDGRS